MIAATHFDPVVGVDIHIIQPPGPVPPVPVPHPFVGMVIDPMEYAPIIGGTVKVNGMMRGTAGTGGKCLPPHIPIGGVFVKPPANECEIFMGSQTVAFDGDPASRLGLPALSCHCVGMPSPPRKKPHTKPKSLTLPTTVVMAVPKGPPVLIGGPPTISLMAMAMKFGMAVLGRALKKLRQLQKASKRWAGISDRMRKAANKLLDKVPGGNRLKNAVSNGICTLTGHPVDVATGKVTTEATDIELPGPLPFRFARVWYSISDYEGPLGHGWHHSYDLGLYEFPEGVVVRLPDGRFATFDRLAEGEADFNRTEKLFLRRTADAYEVEALDGLIYSFGWRGKEGEERPLREVRDPNGNRIELVREKGKLTAFIDSGGRRLPVATDAKGRITEIRGPDPDHAGKTIALVSFAYSRDNDLVEVRNALGSPFRYEYGNHLLLRETDRTGLSFYFMYESDGPTARCLRTWGDNDLFLRDLRYDLTSRRTEEVNALGHKTIYEWNEMGVVTRLTDPLGGVTKTQWGLFGEVLAETNPAGETTAYEYDEFGRLLATIDPAGVQTGSRFDEAGNEIAVVDEIGGEWRYEYDSRRNIVAAIDPSGARWSYRYDHRGLLVEAVDPFGAAIRLDWDNQGNLRRRVDRDGSESRLEHDALGRLVRHIDALGGEALFAHDAGGRVTRIRDESGRIATFRHNDENELLEIASPLGVRRFTRAPGGVVTAVEEPDGARTRYHHDVEWRVIAVEDAAGRVARFELDANDNRIGEHTFEGQHLRYECDAVGRLRAIVNSRGERTEIHRDKAGRVVRRKYADGSQETFAYDPRGLVVKAQNKSATVVTEYDALGQVVSEEINGNKVLSRYDANGNRIERIAPSGRRVSVAYDVDERPRQIAFGTGTDMSIAYDALGRERDRKLPNGSIGSYSYSPTGRMVSYRANRAGRTLRGQDYRFDAAGRIEEYEDSAFGATRFGHDAAGRLTSTTYPDGVEERHPFDKSGNCPGLPDQSRGRDRLNELVRVDGVELRFDENGNVVEKRKPDGRWLFDYDAAGRLAKVTDAAGASTRFDYDPLGRRIRKQTAAETVEFLWDGDDLIAEVRSTPANRVAIEYDYVPGTYEPLAQFGPEGPLFVECNAVGLPVAATDSRGEVVWQAHHHSYGRVRRERGAGTPLRFAGQYEDNESGLFYNRHRYYDPELRMYITPDPLGLAGGLQPYTYVPDPLEWIDPLGLKKKCWVDARGRTQVVITFPTKKKARDARPRPKPQKPKAEGGQRTTRQTRRKRGEGARGERHRRGGTHVHDDRHGDPTKPNIHYEFPE